MTLSDLASIGSLVSRFAVLVSLIYLAQQTRQNSKHTRALTRLHGGACAEALAMAYEIIMREMQGYRCVMVFRLLAESIGQTREAAHSHPHW